MFVLPPPPKYPIGSPAYQAALAQLRDNNIDSHNTLKFPTGPDCTFAAGEGESVVVGILMTGIAVHAMRAI